MFDLKISRRSFLIGASKVAVLAAAAPAIVRAESLMKIQVPPEPKIITDPNAFNFTIKGLMPGTRVAMFDEVTGEVIFNEKSVHGGTMRMNVPERGGSPVIVRSLKHGYKYFQVRTGLPYEGCKNSLHVAMEADV